MGEGWDCTGPNEKAGSVLGPRRRLAAYWAQREGWECYGLNEKAGSAMGWECYGPSNMVGSARRPGVRTAGSAMGPVRQWGVLCRKAGQIMGQLRKMGLLWARWEG